MRFLSTVTCALALSAIAADAQAGAWTQASGSGVAIVNGSYYSTDKLYNNGGNKQSQATYSKYELNPYLEYGLWDGVTAGANLSLQRAHQSSDSNWGLSDSEFFLRKRLWQGSGFIISAEPMVKLPSPEAADSSPKIGGTHPDAGLGLSGGYGFSTGKLNHFAGLDTQYRHRFGRPRDQLRISGTVGISVTERLMIMPQAFLTYRTSNPGTASFTQSSGDDYNLAKLQLSAVYKMSDGVSLQLGGFAHVDGKNVGSGNGVLVAVWKQF